MVERNLSDITLIFDRFIVIPIIALLLMGWAFRFFLRRNSWRAMFFCIFCCTCAITTIYIWIIQRHDYLIVAQNYTREHKHTCHPGAVAPSNFTRHLVLSKYKENMEWTQCPEWTDFPMTIYDKVDPLAPNHIENVGYECTPYLRFILDHYDNLPDITYFMHGNPFEHCPNFHQALQGAEQKPFYMLSNVHQNFYTNGQPQHPPRHGFEPLMKEMWKDLFPTADMPWYGSSYFNGQFAVRRERILRHSREYYERMNWWFTEGRGSDNYSWGRRGDGWLECVVMERLWPMVFGEGSIDLPVYDPGALPVC